MLRVTPSAHSCSEIPGLPLRTRARMSLQECARTATAGAFFGHSGYLFDVQKQHITAEEAMWFSGSSELVQGHCGQTCVYVSCFLSLRAVSRAAKPRKMRAIAQKLGLLLCHMFCCALAGAFWTHPFLKFTCTDFGGGLVQAALEQPCGRW